MANRKLHLQYGDKLPRDYIDVHQLKKFMVDRNAFVKRAKPKVLASRSVQPVDEENIEEDPRSWWSLYSYSVEAFKHHEGMVPVREHDTLGTMEASLPADQLDDATPQADSPPQPRKLFRTPSTTMTGRAPLRQPTSQFNHGFIRSLQDGEETRDRDKTMAMCTLITKLVKSNNANEARSQQNKIRHSWLASLHKLILMQAATSQASQPQSSRASQSQPQTSQMPSKVSHAHLSQAILNQTFGFTLLLSQS